MFALETVVNVMDYYLTDSDSSPTGTYQSLMVPGIIPG